MIPTGSYYISVSPTAVQVGGWAGTVNTSLGYPKAGVDVGDGVHAPPAQSVTTRWTPVWRHPTLLEYAYLADATTGPALSATAGLPIATGLDASWLTATDTGL